MKQLLPRSHVTIPRTEHSSCIFCTMNSLMPLSASRLLPAFTLLAAMSFIGCTEKSEQSKAPPVMTAETDEATSDVGDQQEAKPAQPAGSFGRTTVEGLAFEVPESWERVELSSFQMGIIAARFKINVDSEEITVTLSRSGGGTAANLERWRGQVESSRDEMLEEMTLAGQPAVLIDLQGRFSPGFGKPAADNQRMLGTIIEMPDQGYFIKLTGPAEAVSQVEDDFRNFLKSAVRK